MRIYSSPDELPATLPVFPLTGTVLLPRGQLPLNVFEARYLAMVDAALSGARFIGMVQPTEHEEKVLTPALSNVGCAGRITSFKETDDGRYLITLTGICRFRVAEEFGTKTPFRQIRPDYSAYLDDLAAELSDCRTVTLPGCGHLAFVTRPECVAEEVKRFLGVKNS